MFHVARGFFGRARVKKDYLNSKDVIFPTGTEFLCCKSEYLNGKQHIYLREIRTGFSTNTVLWVDDELFPKHTDYRDPRAENSAILHGMMYSCF